VSFLDDAFNFIHGGYNAAQDGGRCRGRRDVGRARRGDKQPEVSRLARRGGSTPRWFNCPTTEPNWCLWWRQA